MHSHNGYSMSSISNDLACEKASIEIVTFVSKWVAILALAVCAVALLILLGDHIHNLTHLGGGLKEAVIQGLWATAKWSGIVGSSALAVLTTTVCSVIIRTCNEK